MPPIIADTHVFGSRRGYETLSRSPGVTGAEDAVLAEFGFGQSSDERFLGELASRPTALGRSLPSGRFAITRVLKGPPDDGGRPTLERRTAILAPGDYLSLRHSLSRLIASRSLWESHAFAEGRALSLPPGPESSGFAVPRDWQLFDAWVIALEQQRAVVVGSDDAAAEDVLRLAGKVSPRDALRYRWGVRMLAPISWVDVLSLSPSGALDNRRQVHGVSSGGCVHPLVRGAMGASPDSIPAIDDLRAVAGRVASRSAGDGSLLAEAMRETGEAPGARDDSRGRRKLPRMAVVTGAAALLGIVIGVIALLVLRASPAPTSASQSPPPAVAVEPAPAPEPAQPSPAQQPPAEPPSAPAGQAAADSPVSPVAPAESSIADGGQATPELAGLAPGGDSSAQSPEGSDAGGAASTETQGTEAADGAGSGATPGPSQAEIDGARTRIELAIAAMRSISDFRREMAGFLDLVKTVRTEVVEGKGEPGKSNRYGLMEIGLLASDFHRNKFGASSEGMSELEERWRLFSEKSKLRVEDLGSERLPMPAAERQVVEKGHLLLKALEGTSALSRDEAQRCGNRLLARLRTPDADPGAVADAAVLCLSLAAGLELSSPRSGFGGDEFAKWAKLKPWTIPDKKSSHPSYDAWKKRIEAMQSVIERWRADAKAVDRCGPGEASEVWAQVACRACDLGLYGMASSPEGSTTVWTEDWLGPAKWASVIPDSDGRLTPGQLFERLLKLSSAPAGSDAGSDQLSHLKDEVRTLLATLPAERPE